MSYRPDRTSIFKKAGKIVQNQYLKDKTEEDINNLFLEILHGGIHGFCFSLYEDGQKPGFIVSEKQIRRRMDVLRHHTQWVRSFSCIEGNELIPQIAKEYGLKTLVGAWLGTDEEKNAQEIENLIRLAKDGFVDVAAVGNEVLYRNDMPMEQLLQMIHKVKNEISGIPVGYVDAYYEFSQNPEMTEIVDVILCNCYPFWEGTSFDHSLAHMQQMVQQARLAGKGKRIIITETGWPSKGEKFGEAVPSYQHWLKYFINTQLWAMDENMEVFYFSSFDESWKAGAEGEVGAYWGIWDKNGKLKFGHEYV